MKTESSDSELSKKKKPRKIFRLRNRKWVILITIWTFFLAVSMSFISETILRRVNTLIAFLILITIILIGILFDLIGIAVASAKEKPFHSMAANKVKGAQFAVKLVRNAGPVSNFCNDVIGDICGIVSGAAGAVIILQLSHVEHIDLALLSILLSAFVAAMTVGGKAIAKEIALNKSKEIVFYVGKLLYLFHEKIGIDFLPEKKKKN
ncbi:hypothetical protein QBE52_09935 [Clostridiaceae bacterium 35-E11]